jgi:hypothetical protein
LPPRYTFVTSSSCSIGAGLPERGEPLAEGYANVRPAVPRRLAAPCTVG